MNTRILIQFTAVAHAGTITEAAKRLNIAQPALSHAIATLEEELGVKLFDRHPRGVELTEAGSILLERSQPILEQLESAKVAVREVDANPTGRVGIALPASVANVLTRPLFEAVRTRYEKIHLVFEEGLTGHLIRWLRSGHIDLMIDFDVEPLSEFDSKPLFREDLFLTGANLDINQSIRFKELGNYPMFLPSKEHAMGRAISEYEAQLGITLNRIPASAAVHPLLSLLEAGLGYAIAPWSMIYDRVAAGKLSARKILEPGITRTAFLLHRRSPAMTTAARMVHDLVLDATTIAHKEGKWRGTVLSRDATEPNVLPHERQN